MNRIFTFTDSREAAGAFLRCSLHYPAIVKLSSRVSYWKMMAVQRRANQRNYHTIAKWKINVRNIFSSSIIWHHFRQKVKASFCVNTEAFNFWKMMELYDFRRKQTLLWVVEHFCIYSKFLLYIHSVQWMHPELIFKDLFLSNTFFKSRNLTEENGFFVHKEASKLGQPTACQLRLVYLNLATVLFCKTSELILFLGSHDIMSLKKKHPYYPQELRHLVFGKKLISNTTRGFSLLKLFFSAYVTTFIEADAWYSG